MKSSTRMADTCTLILAPKRADKSSAPSHARSDGPGPLVAVFGGIALLGVAAVLVWRGVSRKRLNLPPEPPRIDPAQAWDAAAPGFEALGFARAQADRFALGGRESESASIHLREDKTLRASLDGQAAGGMIDTFLKQDVYLAPGKPERSDFGRWAYGSVASAIVRLHRDARVHIEVPHLPGERYEVEVSGPLFAADHAVAAAEVLVRFAEAARVPASAEALTAALPRVARLMMEADRDLATLGLGRDTLVTYRRHGTGTLSVDADDGDETLTGRYRRPLPEAAIERYIGVAETIHPGGHAGHELGRWLMSELGAEIGALPHETAIAITVAKLPGDDTHVRVTLPFKTASEAVAVARLLAAFERIASRPLPPGSPPAPFSPLAQRWIAAGPLLVAAGLEKGGPDSYRGGALTVDVDVDDETLEGRVYRHVNEQKIALFAGTEVELGPGDTGRSPLGKWAAGVIGHHLACLPRGSTLKVEAPRGAGDTYTIRVEAPFKDPAHAKVIVDLLATLDAAALGPPV